MSPGLKSSRIGTNRPAGISSATLNAPTVGACLTSVLEEAARYYATYLVANGCLMLYGTRSSDEQAREAARPFHRTAEGVVRACIATCHPEDAQRLTDFVSTTMSGPSAKARNGHGLDQLLATARLAALL
jgi:TetR/AcrR family transcriptional repressor for divergent bdcA